MCRSLVHKAEDAGNVVGREELRDPVHNLRYPNGRLGILI